MSETPIRVLIMGDTHCGSISGLTPPSFDSKPGADREPLQREMYDLRRWLYNAWSNRLDLYRPIDIAVFNGDLVDGDQRKSHGMELIELDRMQQVEMAKKIVKNVDAAQNYFVQGTGYHTGDREDFEELVANAFDTNAVKELSLKINGVYIVAEHHAPASQMVHTRNNSLSNLITEFKHRIADGRIDILPGSQAILVRSHAHYYGRMDERLLSVVRVPALQLPNGSTWARRFASGKLDFGFIVLEVYPNGRVIVEKVLLELPPEKIGSITSEKFFAAYEQEVARKSVSEIDFTHKPSERVSRGRVATA